MFTPSVNSNAEDADETLRLPSVTNSELKMWLPPGPEPALPTPVPRPHRLWLSNALLVQSVAARPEWRDVVPGMPQLALSTGYPGLKGEPLRQLLRTSLKLGYRHFDIEFGDGLLADIGMPSRTSDMLYMRSVEKIEVCWKE